MNIILVVSEDEGFKKLCEDQLDIKDHSLHFALTHHAALQYLSEHQLIDLVILNSDSCGRDCYHMLEVIRSFKPQINVVLASGYYNYWNNFRSWMADDCVVTSTDLTELRNRVGKLLGIADSGEQEELDNSQFSVDWV